VTLLELIRRHPASATVLSGAMNRRMMPFPTRVVRSTFSDGRTMALRLEDRTQRQMLLDRFEPTETALLQQLLAPGDVYVDIGAHVGWFVTQAARLVGPSGRVYAVEAFPQNFQLLRHNVALNRYDNVAVYHMAAADEAGETTIGTQGNQDSGSATAGARAANAVERVPQATLDATLPDDLAPALLKIDVEGFEERVLRGAGGILSRARAALVELNPSSLRANGSHPDRIVAMLESHGLRHHRLISERATRFSDASIPNILATRAPHPLTAS
jgi:FkbM family methyltransferase